MRMLAGVALVLSAGLVGGCGAEEARTREAPPPGLAGGKGDYWYDWAGNSTTRYLPEPFAQGTTSFAVLDRARGRRGDTWGSGLDGFDRHFVPGLSSPILDTQARYIYLYQDVADHESGRAISTIFTEMHPGVPDWITSWGHFTGLGLADDEGAVSADNPFGWPGSGPGDTSIGVRAPRVVAIAEGPDAGLDPDAVYLTLGARPSIDREWNDGVGLLPGRRATLVGFTSDLPPNLTPNHVRPDDGDCSAPPPASPGIAEGSPDARGVLRLINLVSALYLVNPVGVSPPAARRIEEAFARRPAVRLSQVLPLVNDCDFDAMLWFARDNGYVPAQ